MERYYDDDDDPSFGSESSDDDSSSDEESSSSMIHDPFGLEGGSDDSSSDGESSSSEEDAEMDLFRNEWQRIKDNDPNMKIIEIYGDGEERIDNVTNDEWEQFGHDVANNTHLKDLCLSDGTLNNQKMTSLFRGLTGSNSIEEVHLTDNRLGVEGVRSMVPFLQNASNLKILSVIGNDIGSDGFKLLMRVLSDSPIEFLHCNNCDIETIEIDGGHIPKNLKELWLNRNRINADGCRELAKLLLGADSTLTTLALSDSRIDDEGV